MIKTEDGIKLTKDELTALLAFASDDPSRQKLYGVHFIATKSKVKARATNGHIALDAVGPNESENPNEWFVHRDFLKRAHKALDNKSSVTLKFSGASLYDAVVHNDDGVEVYTVSSPEDVANSQMTFPDPREWNKLLKPPPKTESVNCVTLNAEYLGLMSKVSRAAGVYGIDCYPPPSTMERVVFRCEGDLTSWIAVVMPMRSEASERSTPSVADASGNWNDVEPEGSALEGEDA